MIDVAICCDNFYLINILKIHISKYSNLNNISFRISTYNSIEDVQQSKFKKFKILLLSLSLQDKNDVININKELNSLNHSAQVIYMPDFIDFVIHGVHLKDSKVLLKPVDYLSFCSEFESCLETFKDIYHSNPMSIYFINSYDNRCMAYTSNDSYLIPIDINSLENKLDKSIFFRCNDNCVINLHQIRKITKDYVIVKDNIITIDKAKFNDLKYKLLNILKL